MDIWVQYTIPVLENGSLGQVELGGGTTKEFCYRPVTRESPNMAGFGSGQLQTFNKPIEEMLGREIEKTVSRARCRVRLAFGDEFNKVFEIFRLPHEEYDSSKHKLVVRQERKILVAVFVRMTPVHIASSMKGFLREVGVA